MADTMKTFTITLVLCLGCISMAFAQGPYKVFLKFALEDFDFNNTSQLCFDVQLRADTADLKLSEIGMRFFFNDTVLQFDSFSNFIGGYEHQQNVDDLTFPPPTGQNLFNFSGPLKYRSDVIKLVNTNLQEVIPTDTFRTFFQACFTVKAPFTTLPFYCPYVIWDHNLNTTQEDYPGVFQGSGGVEMSVIQPGTNDPMETASVIERTLDYNFLKQAGLPRQSYR